MVELRLEEEGLERMVSWEPKVFYQPDKTLDLKFERFLY